MKSCKCGNKISPKAIRCNSCENKRRHLAGILNSKGENNPFFNKKHSEITKKIMSKNHANVLGKLNGNYKGGKPKCKCGKEINYSRKQCKSCATKGRNNPMFGIHRFGKNSPHYINGNTKFIKAFRNLKKYILWRNKVFKRDNYTCQICNKTGNINAHHKIPVSIIFRLYNLTTIFKILKCKLLWDVSWGITLCEKCHLEIKE
jgi:hypothetical protein